MKWTAPLLPATFLHRDNRFRATVQLGSRTLQAHVANSGRLRELFVTGAPVWVKMAPADTQRKTECDVTLVAHAGILVSVDARLPNRLLREALIAGRLECFSGYESLQAEATVGHSRLDFLLTGTRQRCWLETKSVTLVEGGLALFPDAPTERGVRHLRDLAALRAQGDRVAVLFVIQRPDAGGFSPHPTAHPAFAEELRRVHALGVEVHAWRCQVSLQEIALAAPVPVRL